MSTKSAIDEAAARLLPMRHSETDRTETPEPGRAVGGGSSRCAAVDAAARFRPVSVRCHLSVLASEQRQLQWFATGYEPDHVIPAAEGRRGSGESLGVERDDGLVQMRHVCRCVADTVRLASRRLAGGRRVAADAGGNGAPAFRRAIGGDPSIGNWTSC